MPPGAFAGDFVNDAGAAFPAWPVLKPWLARAEAVWLELRPAAFHCLVDFCLLTGWLRVIGEQRSGWGGGDFTPRVDFWRGKEGLSKVLLLGYFRMAALKGAQEGFCAQGKMEFNQY